ncbi:MAG TPA: kinase/pyrophosphorylase [Thiotrichales bacterium]|nr:kinase/pyrophosphorylase [Thiotrichales bacterium]
MRQRRTVYFLSDHTGITVEAMGRSLLSQFPELEIDTVHWPFIDRAEKAEKVAEHINRAAMESAVRPIVFSTLVDPEVRGRLKGVRAWVFDFFESCTDGLAEELGLAHHPVRGCSHGVGDLHSYHERIHAVNYALTNDDGAVTRNYPAAEVILIGVSRSGKTPTCLFLGLQHGILAANWPLTEEELEPPRLPEPLVPWKGKLFGLTIDPLHLQRIRQERRPTGRYSSLEQCRNEVRAAERLFDAEGIPSLDTTAMSVEEIATRLLQKMSLESRMK